MTFNLNSEEHSAAVLEVQEKAGYHFQNQALLMEALTHPSYAAEMPIQPAKQTQRLEFFGDAVLQIILSKYLFMSLPEAQEGTLTRMRSYLANEAATAAYARRLGLDRVLLLGKGECTTGGRERTSIQGDAFEAFLGAVTLDGGFAAARTLALSLIPPLELVEEKLVVEENPKGALQEFCQSHHLPRLNYELLSKTGPVHSPTFTVRVTVGNRELSRASGPNHKLAEREAAMLAYNALETELAKSLASATVVLDFDGVLCDSVRECCASAWKAARTLWPDLFVEEMPDEETYLRFRQVRPYLEVGFEGILLLKMVQEEQPMLEYEQNLKEHFQRILYQWELTEDQLKKLYGDTRDRWIQEDFDGWLAMHSFYPGVIAALTRARANGCRVYISTTKQERFVQALLERAGVDFPPENIHGLDRKEKKEALLLRLCEDHERTLYFVEDRLKTLLRVAETPGLEEVSLHFATWGYVTRHDQEAVRQTTRIHSVSLTEFTRRFGNDVTHAK